MNSTIDKFGRIVIPKHIRDHLGLRPGSTINIEEKENKVILSSQNSRPSVEFEDGVLVFNGEPLDDISNAIKQNRDQYIKKFAFK